jgi:hypothetical protein
MARPSCAGVGRRGLRGPCSITLPPDDPARIGSVGTGRRPWHARATTGIPEWSPIYSAWDIRLASVVKGEVEERILVIGDDAYPNDNLSVTAYRWEDGVEPYSTTLDSPIRVSIGVWAQKRFFHLARASIQRSQFARLADSLRELPNQDGSESPEFREANNSFGLNISVDGDACNVDGWIVDEGSGKHDFELNGVTREQLGGALKVLERILASFPLR